MAITASTACRVEASVVASHPARVPSSNWFGVTRSAAGTTRSRSSAGMAGLTKQPDRALPITGSQV